MISNNSLVGKVAIITGAAGLLGREHAAALLELGAIVILTDINEELLSEAKKELQNTFNDSLIHIYKMDVTSEGSIISAMEYIVNRFKTIDILINNAAIDPKVKEDGSTIESSRLENFSIESWNFQIAVGLTGAMLCCKHFGSFMAKNNGGVILNIASDLSIIAPDQRLYSLPERDENHQPVKPVTYSVIKHGLHGLTKYVSTYWPKNLVRVNSLSPGGVFNNQPKEFLTKIERLIPMGRMAEKSEYRGSIQFLCTDASSYMTGQNIVMDGGRSVW